MIRENEFSVVWESRLLGRNRGYMSGLPGVHRVEPRVVSIEFADDTVCAVTHIALRNFSFRSSLALGVFWRCSSSRVVAFAVGAVARPTVDMRLHEKILLHEKSDQCKFTHYACFVLYWNSMQKRTLLQSNRSSSSSRSCPDAEDSNPFKKLSVRSSFLKAPINGRKEDGSKQGDKKKQSDDQ